MTDICGVWDMCFRSNIGALYVLRNKNAKPVIIALKSKRFVGFHSVVSSLNMRPNQYFYTLGSSLLVIFVKADDLRLECFVRQ